VDEQSGESKDEDVIGGGIGESGIERLVSEWCWRRDIGSWFYRSLRPTTQRVYLVWRGDHSVKKRLSHLREHSTIIADSVNRKYGITRNP